MTVIDLRERLSKRPRVTRIDTVVADVKRALPGVDVYACVMLRNVSVGELLHALTGSGIVLSTDPSTGFQILHRPTTPPDGAA